MTLEALAGHVVGPAPFSAAAEAVAGFVAATGDDAVRWAEFAPPGLAAAAFFAVAPSLLAEPGVARFGASLLHTEQAFSWHRALRIGEALLVSGRVTAVRSRGSRHLVSFAVEAGGGEGLWMEGASTFLLSDQAIGPGPDAGEPPMGERAAFDPAETARLPREGEPLPPLRRSASRADLLAYAAAGGDWNPIHRDHEAARAGGLPGVVAHGLLLAAWLLQAAARFRPGPYPLRSAQVRFRRPLRPAVSAVITGTVVARGTDGVGLQLALGGAAGEPPYATAAVRVTP